MTFILVIVHPTAVLFYQKFGIFTTVKLRVGGGLGLSSSPVVMIGMLPFPADDTRFLAGPHQAEQVCPVVNSSVKGDRVDMPSFSCSLNHTGPFLV